MQKDSGLYADDEIILIVLQNLVHLLHVDHDTAVNGYRRSCQAGTGTARDDWDIIIIAEFRDSCDIFCRRRIYNCVGGI